MTTEPRPKGKHFTKDERAKIETLRKAGHTHQYIADFLGCCRSAVTKEIKKGQVDHLDGATWLMTKVYDAYAAQKYADYQKTAHSTMRMPLPLRPALNRNTAPTPLFSWLATSTA